MKVNNSNKTQGVSKSKKSNKSNKASGVSFDKMVEKLDSLNRFPQASSLINNMATLV